MALDLAAFSGSAQVAASANRLSTALAIAHIETRARAPSGRRRGPLREGLLLDRLARVIRGPRIEVFGAGVILKDGEPRPMLLVDERATRAAPGEIASMEREPEIQARCVKLLRVEPGDDTVVFAVPPPTLQFSTGQRVTGPLDYGTLGARVETASGQSAILTAGHIVEAGDIVRDPNGAAGRVTRSISPTRAAAKQACADVAVIEAELETVAAPSIGPGGAKLEADAEITMYGSVSGECEGRMFGALPQVVPVPGPGFWADVVLTGGAISQPGDSGSAVTLKATGELVGHLVGASGTFTSFIQDIDVQLEAAAAKLAAGAS